MPTKLSQSTTELLNDVQGFFTRYCAFPQDAYATALSLWVLHTWAFDAAYCTPYIYINSAEKRSGKTTVLDCANALSPNSQKVEGVTGAGIFKNLVQTDDEDGTTIRMTLLIDEADAIFTGAANDDLRGVLNSGFKRSGTIMRAAGTYSTWSPKMLAGIDNGAMPDTVRDRSIMLNLLRASESERESLTRWHERDVDKLASELTDRLLDWAQSATTALSEIRPKEINVNPRAFDISEPLLAIAELAGGDWMKNAREHLTWLLTEQEDETLSPGAKILLAAKEIMERENRDKVFSAELEAATGIPSVNIGKTYMRPYGISPTTFKINGQQGKGYRKEDMTDAWERYLPKQDKGE